VGGAGEGEYAKEGKKGLNDGSLLRKVLEFRYLGSLLNTQMTSKGIATAAATVLDINMSRMKRWCKDVENERKSSRQLSNRMACSGERAQILKTEESDQEHKPNNTAEGQLPWPRTQSFLLERRVTHVQVVRQRGNRR